MAKQEQLKRLQADINDWNIWREQHPREVIDLSGATLGGATLNYANLSDATLSGATLNYANLSYANLSYANLSYANLSYANLNYANLSYANLNYANLNYAELSSAELSSAELSGANLSGANLSGATLSGATLSGAVMAQTILGGLDLRGVKGLDTIQHQGPSHLSINTLHQSKGNIPEAFVRGTGAPESFIECIHIRAATSNQYYTCFISYSSKNQDFVEQLYADLQSKGVRCWYAPEDLKIGDYFPEQIEQAIR